MGVDTPRVQRLARQAGGEPSDIESEVGWLTGLSCREVIGGLGRGGTAEWWKRQPGSNEDKKVWEVKEGRQWARQG